MIHTIFFQSIPFLGGAAVAGAANLFSSAKQREQNHRLAMFNARMRREEMEINRRQRLSELLIKHEMDRTLAAEGHAWRQEWEILARTYPFEAGPGQLAMAAASVFPDLRSDQLPIVIIERVVGDGSGLWKNLHTEARISLAELQRQRLGYVDTADRAVRWPNSRLREYDLGGRPAIIVTPEVGADRLHLSVGGCNLMDHVTNDIVPMTPMLTIEFRHSSELQKFTFSGEYDDGIREMTLVPIPRLDESEFNPFEAAREYVKLGAAAIGLLVTRLVDHYHLANQYGYAPRFEKSLALLEARARRAGDSLIQRTDLPEIPELAVADLPYYRLRRALGSDVSRTPDETVAAVAHSLSGLGGCDHPTDVPSVVQLIRSYLPGSPEEGAAYQEARRVLNDLPASAAGRNELLEAVSGVIARLQEVKETRIRRSGPKVDWGKK